MVRPNHERNRETLGRRKPKGFLERAIKAWGNDSPDTPGKPHRCTIRKKTCTIGRKFWFSDSGGCTIAGLVGRKKKRAEEKLRACGVLAPEEEINGAVEAVSFDDTLGKLRRVFVIGFDSIYFARPQPSDPIWHKEIENQQVKRGHRC